MFPKVSFLSFHMESEQGLNQKKKKKQPQQDLPKDNAFFSC